MRIYSMTATFGKLEHETLTLQPGLNLIHAPNEWGKSTWCAFLVAMLYGIETRVHSTKAALAGKERYAPWSGSPMSGRIDLQWEDRDITIERRTKGRSIFGEFRAYETATGLPVTELTGANCGQLLLGVEKTVFLRAGFLKLPDLPVTQDDALRRRLNALVTTGDESGASDALSQKLRDLKNRCRFNKSGLLPQAEQQRDQLEEKLAQLSSLQVQVQRIHNRQSELKAHIAALENHKAALKYAESRSYAQKLAAASLARDNAAAKTAELERTCAQLPDRETAQQQAAHLRQLCDSRDALHIESQMLPPAPQPPQTYGCFRGLSVEDAISQAQEDAASFETLAGSQKKTTPLFWILSGLFLAGSIGLLMGSLILPAAILGVLGVACICGGVLHNVSVSNHNSRLEARASILREKYRPLQPDQWVLCAEVYAKTMKDFEQAAIAHRREREQLDLRITSLNQQLQAVTGDRSIQACLKGWEAAISTHDAYADARRELQRAEEWVQTLTASHRDVPPPQAPDPLEYTEAETARFLSDAALEQHQLQLRLGQCMGQMENLGHEELLRQQLQSVQERISRLEETYTALTLAQQTLTRASNELQRRFAPQISQRAQQLFARLTGSRYDRLALEEDLSLSAGAADEDTLRTALWRSDGTADQLYLALRLAVAEALTPDAPLILDDALVRFDDQRLASALEILREEAATKQVLLFTCQSREQQLLENTP